MPNNNDKLLGGEELNINNRPIDGDAIDKLITSRPKTDDPNVSSFVRRDLQFDPEYDAGRTAGQETPSQARNRNQSGFEMFRNFLTQGVIGEGIGGTLEATGYISGLITEAVDPAAENELAFDNWLAGLGRNIRDNIREDFPIYEAEPGTLNPGDPAYWASNGVSVFSTLSLAVPGFAIAKGLGWAAKSVKALKAAGAIEIGGVSLGTVSEVLTTTIGSRHAENTMESAGVFKDVYERLTNQVNPKTNKPYTDSEAKAIAADAAASTYNWNWLAVLPDILQYGMMLTGVGNVIKSAKSALGTVVKRSGAVAGVGLSEAGEELYQHNVQEEAIRQAFINADIQPENNLHWLDRLAVNSSTDEGKTAAIIGGLAGAGQVTVFREIVPKLFNKKATEESSEQEETKVAEEGIKNAASKLDAILQYDKTIIKSSDNLDEATYNFTTSLANADIKYSSIANGNLQQELDRLDEYSQEKSQTLEGGQLEDFKSNVERIKNDLIELDKIHKHTKSNFTAKVANKEQIIEQESKSKFIQRKLKEEVDSYKSQINEQAGNFEDLEGATKELRDLEEELSATRIYRDNITKELERTLPEDSRKAKQSILTKLEREIVSQEKKIDKFKNENETKEYSPRTEIQELKYHLKRSENNYKDASNKVNQFKNANYLKSLDDQLTKINEKREALKSQIQDDEVEDNIPAKDSKPIDWTSPETFIEGVNRINVDHHDNSKISKDGSPRKFPKHKKFVESLISSIDEKVGRDKAVEALGAMYPIEGAQVGEGIDHPNGNRLRLNPDLPGETFPSISQILVRPEDFHENKEDLIPVVNDIIDVIKEALDNEMSDNAKAQTTEAISSEGNTQETQGSEKTSETKRATKSIYDLTALYSYPKQGATDIDADLYDFLKEGFDYITDPDGLQEGEEIRIIPAVTKEDFERYKNGEDIIFPHDVIKKWYDNIISNGGDISAKNATILIQAKVKGNKWSTISLLSNYNTINKLPKDVKDSLNLDGRGPQQLLDLRNEVYGKSKGIKTTVDTIQGVKKYDKTGQRYKVKEENIKLYDNRPIIGYYNGEAYIVGNEEELEAEISTWNIKESDANIAHKIGRPQLLVKGIDGKVDIVQLDSMKLSNVDGAVDAVLDILGRIKDSTSKSEFLELKNRLNEITYTDRKSLTKEKADNNGFNVTQKLGLSYSIKGQEEPTRISWEEFENRKGEIIEFLNDKVMNFISEKANKKGSYVNPITLESVPSYNDYILETATDTNWNGTFVNGTFSINPVTNVAEAQLDDTTDIEEAPKKKPAIKKTTGPKDNKGNDIIIPLFDNDGNTREDAYRLVLEKPDVILPIGTSGSGKSTFIKTLSQENLVVIEPDTMRVEFTGNMNDKSKDKEIYIEAANRAVQAIKQGKQVVFDTTNLTKDKRLPFIEAIKKAIPNANIQYKLMELNPELAKQRIKADIAAGKNRANVPDSTIDRHAESYKQMLEDIKSEPITPFIDRFGKYNVEDYEIISDEELNWLKKTLPNVPVEIHEALINVANSGGKQAWGVFKNAAIGLYRKAEKGTAYHEAFHAVFRLYTTEKQRQALYLEAQKLYGGNGNLAIEEDMAEAFMSYMLNKPYLNVNLNKSKSKLKKFFDNLIRLVKEILGKPLTIEEFFNKVSKGKFDSSNLQRDVTKFEEAYRAIPSFTSKERKARVNTLANFVWRNIQGKIERGEINSPDEVNVAGILTEVRDSLEYLISDEGPIGKHGNEKQIGGIVKMLDNFDLLGKEVVKFYETFDFITKNQAALEEVDLLEDVIDGLVDPADLHEVPYFEINRKDKANPLVKRYIRFMTTTEADDLGFPELVNYHHTYSAIAKTLAGSSTLEEMIGRLKEVESRKPEYTALIKELESDAEVFKSAFFSTFANQDMRFLTIGSKEDRKLIYMTNRKNLSNTLVKEWENNFNRSEYSTLEDGVYRPNIAKISRQFDKLDSFVDRLRNKKFELESKDYKLAQNLYQTLGIDISVKTLEFVSKGNSTDLVKFLYGAKGRGLYGIMKRVVERSANPFATDKQNEKSGLLSIAKLEGVVRPDLYNASTTGAKGNKKHGITYQSYMSNLFESLKNKAGLGLSVIYKFDKQVIFNPDKENRSLLLRMFDRRGDGDKVRFENEDFVNRFDWMTFESTDSNGRVKEYSDLSPKDKLVTDLELFLDDSTEGWAWFTTPTPSDKSNTRVVKLPKLSKKEAFDELLKQAFAEYARVKKVMTEVQTLPPNKQIKNYHFKYENGQKVLGNGAKFVMFPKLNEFIVNGKLAEFNTSIAKKRIGEMMQEEIESFHDKMVSKKGYSVIYRSQGSKIFDRTSLSPNSVKEYTDSKTKEIDSFALAEDYVTSSFVWNNELTKILNGDPAYYKDLDDANKRSYQYLSGMRRARVGKEGVKPNVRSLILKEPVLKSKRFGNIDIADAQGYITLDYYVRYMKGLGEWTPKHEKALNNIKNGKSSPRDNALIFKPLKFFTYDNTANGPIQIKHSVMPLIPALVKTDTKLAKLKEIMEAYGIDEVNFESGVKVGSKGVIPFESIDNVDIESNVFEFSNSGRGIITETDPKDEFPKYGSQIRKLIFSLVGDEDMYTFNNKEITGKELKDKLHALISTNLKLSSQAVGNLFKNNKKLKDRVLKQFNDRGIVDNVEKMLEIEDGKFKYPISFPGIMKKIEQIFNAFYRNTVTVNRVFGQKAFQFSSYGINEDLKYISGDNKFAEIAISEDLFKKFDGDLTKVNDYFKEGVIYRIPTQSKSSMLPVKVVKVLPKEVGNLIQLPLEVVAQMGSDFDIDSVNLMLKQPDAKKGSKANRNNEIIDLTISVLTSDNHLDEVTTPVGHGTVEAFRDSIISDEEVAERNNRPIGSPNVQFDNFRFNSSGKRLIGAFANQVTHHAISNNVPYTLAKSFTINGKEVTEIGLDPNKKVTNYLQELLNMAVDNTKDAIAGDINANNVTAGPLALLVRMGYPLKNALEFIYHPQVRKIVKEYYKFERINKSFEKVSKNFTEEMGKIEEINISPEVVNSEKPIDQAKVVKAFIELYEQSKILNNDIKGLGFDGSNKVGSTLLEKEAFVEAMGNEEGNVFKQTQGFPQLRAFFQHGVLDPLEVIGEMLPTTKSAFKSIFAALNLSKAPSNIKEMAVYSFMNYTFREDESPIKNIFSFENRNKLFKGDLWDRLQEQRKKFSIIEYLTLEEEDGIKYISFNNKADWTVDELSDLSQSWLEMFQLPSTRELARELVEYSMNATGFSYSPNSISNLIPAEYWIDKSYSNTDRSIVDYWKEVELKLGNPTYPKLAKFAPLFIENYINYNGKHRFVENFTEEFKAELFKTAKIEGYETAKWTTINGELIPTSIKIDPKSLSKKVLNGGWGNITVDIARKDKSPRTFILRYAGNSSDGYAVFNVTSSKGKLFRLQEYDTKSIIKDNNVVIPEGLFFQVDDTSIMDTDSIGKLDDTGIKFTEELAYLDAEEEYQYTPDEELTDEHINRLKEAYSPQYQINSKEYEKANEDLDKALKGFLSQIGVKVQAVDSLKTRLGENAVAAAYIVEKVIKVAKGEARLDTLPEEAAHFFVETLGLNHPLIRKMYLEVQETGVYKEVLKEYYETYDGDEVKIVKEAMGKAIAQEIVGEFRKREANKNIADKISKTINYIVKRIKSIFSKTSPEKFDSSISSMRLAAEMILDNTLATPNDIREYKINLPTYIEDLLDQAIAGNIDDRELAYYQKSEKKHRPVEDVVSDPTVSEAEKINAVLENALDILIRREKALKGRGIQGQEKAKQISEERARLEILIKQKLGSLALVNFVKNSAKIINDAYTIARKIEKEGENYTPSMKTTEMKTTASELVRINKIAHSYDFIDQVLNMAMKEGSDSQLKKIQSLLQDLRDKKDVIKTVQKTVGKKITAQWLNEVGSSSMTKEELNEELEMGSRDISWSDRMLRAMSQVSDPILQLIDKAVRVAKQEARLRSREYTDKLVRQLETFNKTHSGKALDKYKKYIEFYQGKPTGYFVSQYTAEFYVKNKERNKLLSEAKELQSIGKEEQSYKVLEEAFKLQKELFDVTEVNPTIGDDILVIKDKFKNKDYKAISQEGMYKTLIDGMRDATNRLPSNKRNLYDRKHERYKIPTVKKSFMEKVKDNGLGSIDWFEGFKSHESDTEFGILDEHNEPMGQVPVFYTTPMEVDEMSFDLPVNVQMYFNMAQNNFSMHKILDKVELAKDVIRDREVQIVQGNKLIKRLFGNDSERAATTKGGYAFELLKDYIDAQVYGQKKVKSGNIGNTEFNQQKTLGKFLQYNAITNLSTNIFAAVANPIVGGTLQSIESFSAEFFNKGTYAKATKLYAENLPGIIEDTYSGRPKSKVGVLNELFDGIQEYATFEAGVKEVKNKYGNVFSGKALMFLQGAGEHWIQSRLVISMLLSKTYDGKVIRDKKEGEKSLWEQFEVKDGKTYYKGRLVTQVPGLQKQIIETHLQILAINQRLHGNYTDIDRSAAHRTMVGQLAFQFRNWMVSGYDRRWGKARGDERLKTMVEGNYRTAGNFALELLRDLKQAQFNYAASWDKLNNTQKANIRRTLAEVTYFVGLLLLLNFAFAEDGDDDDFTYNFLAYQTNRLYTELLFYIDIRETTKLAKSPAAAISTFEKLINLGGTILQPWNWGEEYQSGSRKGELKLKKAVSDLVPLWRDVERTKHVKDLLQFFND